MAKLNIPTTVIGPKEIIVPLVREDHLRTSNIFRICFEVSLAIFASLAGSMGTMDKPLNIHWVFLIITGISTIAFIILASVNYKKAKSECSETT